jgi:hypothetical protein
VVQEKLRAGLRVSFKTLLSSSWAELLREVRDGKKVDPAATPSSSVDENVTNLLI